MSLCIREMVNVDSLFHRKGPGPRRIVLELIFILVIRLILRFYLDVSVIELVDSAHIRQEGRRARGGGYSSQPEQVRPSMPVGSGSNVCKVCKIPTGEKVQIAYLSIS